jgi:hypothetical protein
VGGEDIGPRMARKLLRLRQMAWSTATHRRFPPAFKAAARALFLAARRDAAAARAPRPSPSCAAPAATRPQPCCSCWAACRSRRWRRLWELPCTLSVWERVG